MSQEVVNRRLAAFFKSHSKDSKLSADEFQFLEAALVGSNTFPDALPLLASSQFTPFSVKHTPLHIPVPPSTSRQSVKKLEISHEVSEAPKQEVNPPARCSGNFGGVPQPLEKGPGNESSAPSPPRVMTRTAQSLMESIMSPEKINEFPVPRQPETRPIDQQKEQRPYPHFAFDLSSFPKSTETFDAKGLPAFSFELY
jgi:hypothetical protein